jgi:hypothetical protein
MTIFLVLNGIGVGFMLYVFVNFWREGRQMRRSALRSNRLSAQFGNTQQVFVVTRAMGSGTEKPDTSSVVHFPSTERRTNAGREKGDYFESKAPVMKYSSR